MNANDPFPSSVVLIRQSNMPLYYRGLELCRAVPTSQVAQTVLRVLEGWMSSMVPELKIETVRATLTKVKQVFHPSEEVRS